MSSVKRISGDYTISSVGASDNVSVITNTFTVNGNFIVTGNTTTIQSNTISTFDPTITLNGNIASNAAPFAGNSGVEVNRGNQPTTALYWNETIDAWQIASNIANYTTYANILTGSAASGNVTTGTATRLAYYQATGSTVVDTGTNLTWTSNSVLTVTGNVVATNYLTNSKLYLKTTSSAVASLAGNIVVAAATANSGGTGLYVNNGSNADELVSKTKARKFGLIL